MAEAVAAVRAVDPTGGAGPAHHDAAGQGSPPESVSRLAARTFRVVRVVSVGVSLPEQFPVVVLEDTEAHRRRLEFRIGIAEGVALAHALGGTGAPRPLTQDLFRLALERFGIDVLAVRLTARVGPTYLAEVELSGPGGSQVLSCRPSDGLCLALGRRVPAPVLVDDRLFTLEGDVVEGEAVEGEADEGEADGPRPVVEPEVEVAADEGGGSGTAASGAAGAMGPGVLV